MIWFFFFFFFFLFSDLDLDLGVRHFEFVNQDSIDEVDVKNAGSLHIDKWPFRNGDYHLVCTIYVLCMNTVGMEGMQFLYEYSTVTRVHYLESPVLHRMQ